MEEKDEKFYRLLDMQDREIKPDELEFIRECLFDKDKLVRMEAIPLIVDTPYFTDDDLKMLTELCDDNAAVVRTEAYEALSKVISSEACERLRKAVQTEEDEMSRGWAIVMWADSICANSANNADHSRHTAFVLKEMKRKENRKSDVCQLSFFYALYRFDYPYALDDLLSFLANDDYHVRCSVVNDLIFAARREDKQKIIMSFEECLAKEETEAVRFSLIRGIEELKKRSG